MGRRQLHFEGDICEECNIDPVASSGFSLNGNRRWRAVCSTCHRATHSKPWLKFRGEECESCGHVPLFRWALEVHHRDGDKDNNDPENYQTLCSNCHRDLEGLIHQLDGDWEKAEGLLKRFIKALL